MLTALKNATTTTSSEPDAVEKQRRIANLQSLLPADASVNKLAVVESSLRLNGWNEDEAISYLEALSDAESGYLTPISTHVILRGIENSGNTCYIDSLIFALFARMSAFDSLLTQDLAGDALPSVRRLQCALVMVVNRLRRGKLVVREEMRRLEYAVKEVWGQVGGGGGVGTVGRQEDVSELFLLLTSAFKSPFLPIWQSIHHGGERESDDTKLFTERCLQLSITNPKERAPVQLDTLLLDYFFDNRVSDLQRHVPVDAEPDLRPLTPESLSEKPKRVPRSHDDADSDNVLLSGWSMLKVLPFLSSENEAGESTALSFLQQRAIIIPIVLKRYYTKVAAGKVKRVSRPVVVPTNVFFDDFVDAPASSPDIGATTPASAATTPRDSSYVLQLRSVICHLGDSPDRGHFVTYVRSDSSQDDSGTNTAEWLRFDGIGPNRVTTLSSTTAVTQRFREDVYNNAYMLFYELVETHDTEPGDAGGGGGSSLAQQADHRLQRQTEADHRLAMELQTKELYRRRRDNCSLM
ncbi:hypothetical protein RI367_001692 [Sorochytrium milnesiophthora]